MICIKAGNEFTTLRIAEQLWSSDLIGLWHQVNICSVKLYPEVVPAAMQITDGPLAELEALQTGVQQLVEAYTATASHCTKTNSG